MKNTLKRVFALALVFAMCLTVVGCKAPDDDSSEYSYYYEEIEVEGENAGTTNTNSNTPGNTNNGTGNGNATSDVNLKGYKFTINSPYIAAAAKDAIMTQEKDLYKVIDQIQKKYGCTITVTGKGQDMTTDRMRTLIMSGSKVADLVDLHVEDMLPFATAGYIVPWSEAGIDATDKIYVQSYSKLAKVDGKYYGVSFLRPPEGRCCIVFNKDILKSIGVQSDDLYSMVKAKKWTWSKLEEYAKKVVDQNTVSGVTKVWGVGGHYQKLVRSIYVSNGAKLVETKNGKASVAYNTPAMKEALNFVSKLINDIKVYDASNYRNAAKWNKFDNGDYEKQFSNKQLAFLFDETYWIDQYFDQSFDYGILPIPMGPKAKEYMTEAGNARVMCLTSTNAKTKDSAKSAAILKLLAQGCANAGNLNGKYAGEEWWKEDIKMDYFRNDRDKNLEMYEIILDSALVDNGEKLKELKTDFYDKVVINAIYCNSGTIESTIQSLAGYDKQLKQFEFK